MLRFSQQKLHILTFRDKNVVFGMFREKEEREREKGKRKGKRKEKEKKRERGKFWQNFNFNPMKSPGEPMALSF